MHKIYKDNWIKFYKFTIGDFICMYLAFLLPYFGNIFNKKNVQSYESMALILGMSLLIFILINESYKDIYRRGYLVEAEAVIFQVSVVYLMAITVTFLVKTSSVYSRLFIGLMYVATILLTYTTRVLIKHYSKKHAGKKSEVKKVVVFSSCGQLDEIRDIADCIQSNDCNIYEFVQLVFLKDQPREKPHVPVLPSKEAAYDYIKENVVDVVLICGSCYNEAIYEIEAVCLSMGVVVQNVLGERPNQFTIKEVVEDIGKYKVLTSGLNVISARQLFLKRVIDIVGSLVGLVIMGIAFVFVAPVIFIKSPGPIFFSQIRVGVNGRNFKIYKFRSMYMDAEARKADLMAHNKMQGLMFKMDNDPRIIKGIGHFIRASSIDEFPQMWNVLKGDMSLVGTRPPTIEEFNHYDYHHKSRLAMKPGITGLWQISGRSGITNFEDVVELDNKYISEWRILSDIKILLKTVVVVFSKDGAV